jgi:hypothetical protein
MIYREEENKKRKGKPKLKAMRLFCVLVQYVCTVFLRVASSQPFAGNWGKSPGRNGRGVYGTYVAYTPTYVYVLVSTGCKEQWQGRKRETVAF